MAAPLVVRVRAFDDGDFPAAARIYSAVYPDAPVTGDELRSNVERADRARYPYVWIAAEAPGLGVVGYASYRRVRSAHRPDKYSLAVYVDPTAAGRGVGTTLLRDLLESLRARGAGHVAAWTREGHDPGIALLEGFGFVVDTRDVESRLQVADFVPPARGRAAEERLARLGITITTLADELRRHPGCLPELYQAYTILDLLVPPDDPDPPTAPSFDHFLRMEAQHPATLQDAFFLAKDGDLYVGVSYLKRADADPGLLNQDLTGVIPPYHGLGIATALKLRTIAYAQAHAYREIRTFNSGRNTPILALNQKLGFVPRPGWIRYVKAPA